MPKILDRLRRQLHSKGIKRDKAYGMAVSILQRSGVLKSGSSTELTAKGKKRQKLGAAGRAKSRAVVRSNSVRKGKKKATSKQYTYNKKTNRAVLKKKPKKKK